MLKFWTAQYQYPGPHRLDITVKGQDPKGSYWAPTWDMVMNHKKTGNDKKYIDEYHKHMIYMITQQPSCWEELLWIDQAVLVCFCKAGNFCHRHLLTYYLKHYSAQYMGEITDFSKHIQPEINNFQGIHRWLSNFYPSPFTFQNITYPTNEHFFQAWKFSTDYRQTVANLNTPSKAKQMGKTAQLCFNWDSEVKQEVMKTGLELKFQIPELKQKLITTKGINLVEGNTWHDNYWGNCTCKKCSKIPGQNILGKMLMQLRDVI